MKLASKFLTGVAALSLMGGAALAQATTTADGSDDPTGFVRDAQSEATQMPEGAEQGNVLMGKTVVAADGKVVGVVDSVAQEAGNRERIYITRTEEMGGGILSLVVPQNYVPQEQIKLGMSASEARAEM